MPVPAPRLIRHSSHPVSKSEHPAQVTNKPVFQPLTHNLPFPLRGVPAAVGTRGQWARSMDPWAALHKPRKSWEDGIPFDDREDDENLGFQVGLTGAVNAPVSNGSRAQAPFPPLFPSLTLAAPTSYERYSDAIEDDADSDYSPMHYGNGSEWSYDDDADMDDGFDPSLDERYEPSRVGYEQTRAYNSPLLDDLSPMAPMDPASSPGPITPFGEFVDRVVTSHSGAFDAEGHSHPTKYRSREAYQGEGCGAECEQCQSYEVPRAPATATPSADEAYRKLVDPMSEWIAAFVWKVCTVDGPPYYARAPASPAVPPTHLASSIRSLLLSTLLQPPAILLALQYISRLPVFVGPILLSDKLLDQIKFRNALLGDPDAPERAELEAEAPYRVTVLGFMLANKWLEDNTFSNKTWHTISNIPLRWLNLLEARALYVLDHKLGIKVDDWALWLAHIESYHTSLASSQSQYPQPISRPSSSPHTVVRKAIEETEAASLFVFDADLPAPFFMGLAERKREQQEKLDAEVFDVDPDEDGPLPEEYLPKRRTSRAGSSRSRTGDDVAARRASYVPDRVVIERRLPPPAKWSPGADELFVRGVEQPIGQSVMASRHVGYAPRVPMMPANHLSLPSESNCPWSTSGYHQEKRYPVGAAVYAPSYTLARDSYGYPINAAPPQVQGRSLSGTYALRSGYPNVRVSPPEMTWHHPEYQSYLPAYHQPIWGRA